MTITVHISDGPVPPAMPFTLPGAGAIITFEGIVRGEEDGRSIAALDYRTYEPMAQNMLEQIGQNLADRYGLFAIRIEHSRGPVPAGHASFRLTVISRHRKQAISAMDEFIDTMKRDVPIWKMPVFREESPALVARNGESRLAAP
jgi:molybdopterin synthase catalytic subunit